MRLAAVALIALLALFGAMIFSQADLLFPIHAVPSAGPLPPGAERMQVRTPEGDILHGVHFAPKDATGPKTLLLGFGGNAWNAQEVAAYLHRIFPESHVVTFHYRGYRPSTGSPSATALMSDAPLLLDHSVKQIRPDRTVAVGFSIGSGVAASLTRQRELDGLILVTPFDSLKAVAQDLYPWLPVGPFFQHEMNSVGSLAGSNLPVAVLAAGRDEIIPRVRTDALRKKISNLAFDRTFPAGHNDIYYRSDFQESLRDALRAVAPK